MSFIYLASPYAHSDPDEREGRRKLAKAHVAWMMENWQTTYSPIIHGFDLGSAMFNSHIDDYQFWLFHDINMLEQATELHVLMLKGWETSKGCLMEVEYALEKLSIPVKGVDFQGLPEGLIFIHPGDPQLVSVPDSDPPITKPAIEKHLFLVS